MFLKKTMLFETKIVRRFAWVPTDIDGDLRIWLCFYWVKIRYQDGGYYEPETWGPFPEKHPLHWDFDKYGPKSFGTYAMGNFWTLINARLKKEDIPVSKLDNYKNNKLCHN